jgi:hypothetical protein
MEQTMPQHSLSLQPGESRDTSTQLCSAMPQISGGSPPKAGWARRARAAAAAVVTRAVNRMSLVARGRNGGKGRSRLDEWASRSVQRSFISWKGRKEEVGRAGVEAGVVVEGGSEEGPDGRPIVEDGTGCAELVAALGIGRHVWIDRTPGQRTRRLASNEAQARINQRPDRDFLIKSGRAGSQPDRTVDGNADRYGRTETVGGRGIAQRERLAVLPLVEVGSLVDVHRATAPIAARCADRQPIVGNCHRLAESVAGLTETGAQLDRGPGAREGAIGRNGPLVGADPAGVVVKARSASYQDRPLEKRDRILRNERDEVVAGQ